MQQLIILVFVASWVILTDAQRVTTDRRPWMDDTQEKYYARIEQDLNNRGCLWQWEEYVEHREWRKASSVLAWQWEEYVEHREWRKAPSVLACNKFPTPVQIATFVRKIIDDDIEEEQFKAFLRKILDDVNQKDKFITVLVTVTMCLAIISLLRVEWMFRERRNWTLLQWICPPRNQQIEEEPHENDNDAPSCIFCSVSTGTIVDLPCTCKGSVARRLHPHCWDNWTKQRKEKKRECDICGVVVADEDGRLPLVHRKLVKRLKRMY